MPSSLDPRMFQLLADRVQDYAIFLLDVDGRILSWNSGAASIKQYHADEIIGRHFSVFYTAADIARGWPAFELERAMKDGRFEDEGWRVEKGRDEVLGKCRDHGAPRRRWHVVGLLQDHKGLDGAQETGREAAPERRALPAVGGRRAGLRDLHAESGRIGRQLERRCPPGQRLRGIRSHRHAFLEVLYARVTGERRALVGARHCTRARACRGRRLAHAQRRLPVLGAGGRDGAIRHGWTACRLCQGHAGLDATPPIRGARDVGKNAQRLHRSPGARASQSACPDPKRGRDAGHAESR